MSQQYTINCPLRNRRPLPKRFCENFKSLPFLEQHTHAHTLRYLKAWHFLQTHSELTVFFFLLLLGSPSPMQDDLYSPQHPGSPFPDAFLSSTSCTSAPLSPPLLDLGVDIQAELEREAPDLDFTLLDPQGKMDLVFLFHSALCLLSLSCFSCSLLLSFCYIASYLILILTPCTPIKD